VKRRLEIAPTALEALRRVRDKKLRRNIVFASDALADEADAGNPLAPPLDGLGSVHAAGDRWRVLYRVEKRLVQVVLGGPRRPGEPADVYELAARWIELL
jgi:hypothetical protein